MSFCAYLTNKNRTANRKTTLLCNDCMCDQFMIAQRFETVSGKIILNSEQFFLLDNTSFHHSLNTSLMHHISLILL